jgi:Protein of unknown function (DUF3102)
MNAIAESLSAHAEAIKAAGTRVIADVIEIGRHLIEAKDLCGHGNWLAWLDKEFGWTERTALNFMRVHDLSRANPKRVSDLNLPLRSLYLLAAPSTPKEARQEVFDRAASGERQSVADIRTTIVTTKAAKLAHGRKQVARLKERYGDPSLSPPPIQEDLLEQGKRVVEQMNWPTKHRFAQWLGTVYEK